MQVNVNIEIHQAFAMIVTNISKLSVFTFVLVNQSYHSHWNLNEIYCEAEVFVSYFTLSLSPMEYP